MPDEVVELIKQLFEETPKQSLRFAARTLPVTHSAVGKVLKNQIKAWPYKLKRVQALHYNDRPKRVAFSQFLLNHPNPDFVDNIAFSDEATFHVSGMVNRHNVRIWGTTNPHAFCEVERYSPKVNVWCCLMRDRVIGPYFFEDNTINQTNYLNMLETFCTPELNRIQNPELFFQQDGAPPHWGLRVRQYLDQHFPNQWIGRDGPHVWPPRSPDLTPLDFFLWGYVKDRVYATPVRDVAHLVEKIRAEVGSVTFQMLANTWRELRRRLVLILERQGGHIEN